MDRLKFSLEKKCGRRLFYPVGGGGLEEVLIKLKKSTCLSLDDLELLWDIGYQIEYRGEKDKQVDIIAKHVEK